MNHLMLTLGWLVVQVTVVAGLALLLDAILARRCPVVGAKILAAAAMLLVVLTVTAFCPVPGWWAWSGQAFTTPFVRTMQVAEMPENANAVLRMPPVESPPLLRWPGMPTT